MRTVAEVIAYLEDFAPPELAADWDNVGLLLGGPAQPVERIMTCLTVTPESAAEAVEARVNLLITHHPILFRPVRRLTASRPDERTILALASAGVAVYSPHTAFDNTTGGINDQIACRLSLVDVMALRVQERPARCKVVVFVPDSDLERVSDAMFAAGAGKIGEYSQCSFRTPGKGSFFGSDAAQPSVGQKGRREEVDEMRLEVVCPQTAVERVVATMRTVHSYEEPAYDIYPLRSDARGAGAGAGRVGRLQRPTSLAELAQHVKKNLSAALVQVVGNADRLVERVAIVCGSGGEFLHDAARRADVLLTGELRFHDYLSAQAGGLSLILAGHYASERFGVEQLAADLSKRWPELQIWASRRECDPIALSV